MDRRQFLGTSVTGAGVIASAPVWRAAYAQQATPGAGPYGSIQRVEPDANGLVLPEGFTSRVIATSDSPVEGTDYTWHVFPDGGATFAEGDGWVYVSNSEAILPGTGGASAVRFDSEGNTVEAYRILGDTSINCAGGPTPWGTWLSCEEFDWHGNPDAIDAFGAVAGRLFETDPFGEADPVMHPAMGLFQHEAAAVDPVNEWLYMTEDQGDGRLYRYIPDSYPDLSAGRLEAAVLDGETASWVEVPDPSAADQPTKDQVPQATVFPGGEGLWYHDGTIVFTTKGDNRVHALETTTNAYRVVYDAEAIGESAPLRGVDNITVEVGSGDLFVAEDGDDMQVVLITPEGEVAPFAQVVGHDDSEITGPAFSPDGTRLYFSSQRGTDGNGVTFEVTGPFRGAGGDDDDGGSSGATATTNPADTLESAGAAQGSHESDDDGSAVPLVAGGAAVAAAVAAGAAVLARRNRANTERSTTEEI